MNEKEFASYKKKNEALVKAIIEMKDLCTDMNLSEQSNKMTEVAERLQQHRFAVGVMGEFRRGKSTVINSLLGDHVMPSDIRPCSATMNRVTYGEEKKAVICMKNGSSQEIAFEELPKYVTKLEEYADMSANVDEAVVYFPSHFCKDGVDIIDTPGLNDDERMDKVSREVIPKLDVLIMTLVPDSPFSISEARFVRDTLLTNDLSRMIFLVNKIDMVDEEEREPLLKEIRKRIKEKTLDEIGHLMGEESEFYINACKVLNHISIYAISARDSLKGKLKNKPYLLEESGAVEFENALTQLLTGERAALELGQASSLLLATGVQVQRELASRVNALEMSEEEFIRKQEELKKVQDNLLSEASAKMKGLDANEESLREELQNKVLDCYRELEIYLKDVIDTKASTWDIKQMSEPKYQALVIGQLQEKIEDEIKEQIKGFSVRMIMEMERFIGEDITDISEFTGEFARNLKSVIHEDAEETFFDKRDAVATAIDVITDFAGVYGLGGVIAGARNAGVKGAVVGGGIGLVSTLAIASACPFVGVPMLVISCAGGTLASKFATKKIFQKDIAEKKKNELVHSLKKTVEDTVKQLGEEKQLEIWMEEQITVAYKNIRSVMAKECEKMVEDANNSLKEMRSVSQTTMDEYKMKKDEFSLQKEKCEEIVLSVSHVTEWLKGQVVQGEEE